MSDSVPVEGGTPALKLSQEDRLRVEVMMWKQRALRQDLRLAKLACRDAEDQEDAVQVEANRCRDDFAALLVSLGVDPNRTFNMTKDNEIVYTSPPAKS